MGPVEALVAALTDDCEAAAQLRARSPFIGFLTPHERIEILSSVDAEMAQAVEAFRIGWNQYFPPAAELAARSRACASSGEFTENIHMILPGGSGNGSNIKPTQNSLLTSNAP